MLSNGLSASDIALLNDRNGNGNGFFGGDGWWVIIIFALIFGWGGNGNGFLGGGGQSTSVYEGYVLNNDFSVLSNQMTQGFASQERKLDGITNGLCSLGYDNLAQINGVNMNIANSAANITNAITTNGYENRLGQQNIMTQMAQCCCDLKQLNGDTNYNIATQANMIDRSIADGFCKTNFNAQTNTRDIVDSQNAGTRAILDKLCQMENNAKDEKIAELTAKNADLRLAASQQAQNNYLVDKLGYHMPVAAYQVPNPFCGCINGCGGCA